MTDVLDEILNLDRSQLEPSELERLNSIETVSYTHLRAHET